MSSALVLAILATIATSAAQQGVLSNGNSNLPSCAQNCPLLIQAAQACSATNTQTQANWICFCQSAYLTTLRSSAAGICDSTCTNTADNNQISTWYNSNCGSDNGASEHAAGDAAATVLPTSTAASGAQATSAGTGSATTAGSSASHSSAPVDKSFHEQCVGDWWACHYRWVIMLIVLAIVLPLLGAGAHWLKARHDRKVDRMSGGFNAGITERAAPMSKEGFNDSDMVAAAAAHKMESGRPGSPARTRDQFMPYGYGYTHSDASHATVARGGTPDVEKDRAFAEAPRNLKRVMVREKSTTDSSGRF